MDVLDRLREVAPNQIVTVIGRRAVENGIKEIERLRKIEAAARTVVEDDCDSTTHPNCWTALRKALSAVSQTDI